jgi:hypothetical protein
MSIKVAELVTQLEGDGHEGGFFRDYLSASADFVSITDPDTGKLLCKYDPKRGILEFVRRKKPTIIDLKNYSKE